MARTGKIEPPLTATVPFTFSATHFMFYLAGEKPKVTWEAESPLLAAGEDPGSTSVLRPEGLCWEREERLMNHRQRK